MRYIDRIAVSPGGKYSEKLRGFAVDVRGRFHRDDIYFNQEDLERLFERPLKMLNEQRMVWIQVGATRLRYLCYDELIAQFRHHRRRLVNGDPAFKFVSLINTILDDESSSGSDPISIVTGDIEALQHRIDLLEQTVRAKDLELTIKDQALKIKEQSLTIMRLRMAIELSKKNERIAALGRCCDHSGEGDCSEWV